MATMRSTTTQSHDRRATGLSAGPSGRQITPAPRPGPAITPRRRSNAPPPPAALNPLADASPAPKVDDRYRLFLDEWDKGFMDAEECADGYWADVVAGAIPPELEGTWFRNGPGRFTLGGEPIPHPYDGDGFVASLAFRGGAAFFRSRFVATPELAAEADAGKVLFRGTFATQRSGGPARNAGDLYVKNTSNTNVVEFNGRLWTLFEAGQPYALDPATLVTLGREKLGGAFKPGLPFDLGSAESNAAFGGLTRFAQGAAAPEAAAALPPELLAAGGDAVTAHPHVCAATGRLVTFSYRVRPVLPSGPGGAPFVTDITFLELEQNENGDANGHAAPVATRRYTLPGFAFLHDFALTEHYYVVFQNPVTVDNAPYMLGAAPAASCVRWVSGVPTKVHLIPRAGVESPSIQPRLFTAPPLFVFHHANAFETSGNDRKIIIDSIHYDSLPAVGREATAQQALDPDAAFTSRLRRVELNLTTGTFRVAAAFDGYLEMPATDPRLNGMRHKYVYGYHSIFEDPQIGLAKVDVEGRVVEMWRPGPCRFALEPKFVPRRGPGSSGAEDDGWLIAQVFNSETGLSDVVVLDAAAMEAGPVAVVSLREPLPSALHGCWSDTYYGPAGEGPAAVTKEMGPAYQGSYEQRRSVPGGGRPVGA
jgi:all-trans-8'-apo-beta-carotenal 15,15'-oxygenase